MGGLKITREEALDRACEAIQYGKEQGAYMNPNLMDFSRLDLEWLKTIVSRLKEAGIDALRIDDICGACIPAVYKHHAWEVKQILGPDIPLAIHSHNDFELGHGRTARRARGRCRGPRGLHQRARRAGRRAEPGASWLRCSR